MTILQSNRRWCGAVGLVILAFLVAWPVLGTAQDKKDPPHDPSKHVQPPGGPGADANKDLADQIKLLQTKVARLEAALAKTAPAAGGAMPEMGGMKDDAMGGKKMGGGGGMAGMKDDAMGGMGGKKMGGMAGGGGMGGMKDDAMGGMSGGGGGMMMMDDMDMMGMGSMGGAKGKKMKMTAALPGFPGMSHIYHIGASDFFLDHPEHITLSTEQKTKLGHMKQKATTAKASAQRKIEEAEQQLWELTGSDQPDAAKMDAKVREVEKLRGDQRMAFIQSVGESAQVLTDDQRKILIGQATTAPPPTTAPAAPPKTP